jgi:ketosteroid isomerase-like protein
MSTDRDTILQYDQRFFDAMVAGDADLLEALLSDDFVLVGVEDGAVAGKKLILDLVASGALQFPQIASFPDEAIVRVVGSVAIVVGRTGMSFTKPDGTAFVAGSRYTHVYAADSDGAWRLLSAQGTTIKD